MQRIAEAGHIQFPEVPAKWQRVFVTANAIKPEWHIRVQAAFQEFNDSAISKTCNFAQDATEEYVEEIYRLAYRLNCKGVTVYRDGSREMQVLSAGSTAKKVQEGHADLHGELAELRAENERLQRIVHELESENLQRRQKGSRPDVLRGTTRRVETPLGTLYVTITEDDRGQPFEVFMTLGKAGRALVYRGDAMGGWQDELRALASSLGSRLRRGANNLERIVDRDPFHIVGYRGYGTSGRVLVLGRVLQNEGLALADPTHSKLRNLFSMLKRLESDPMPHARVRARWPGGSQELVADDEGFIREWLEIDTHHRSGWESVELGLA